MDRHIDREMVEIRRKRSPHIKGVPSTIDRPRYLEPLRIRDRSHSGSRVDDQRSTSTHSERHRGYDDRHQGRELALRPSGRHGRSRSSRYEDDSDSSDSSSSSSKRSSRRSRSHKPPRNPCGPKCSSHDHRPRTRGPSPPPSSKTIRNHTLLYGALATCATIGTTNTFYQVSKARRLRNKDMSEREMCEEEEKRMKQSGLLWDAFGVACMAIGVNNVRIGWNRYNGWRKQQEALQDDRQTY